MIVLLMLFGACTNGEDPKAVGSAFLKAVAVGDFESAKGYATPAAQASLDLMAATAEARKAHPDQIEIGTLHENGKHAELSYKKNGIDLVLHLAKDSAYQWKATWNKGGEEQIWQADVPLN